MKYSKLRFSRFAVVVGLFTTAGIAGCFLASFAQALPNTSAGAINQHVNQQLLWQNNAPYMFRPATEEDLKPGSANQEPVIMYSSPNVDAKVIPKVPDQSQIQVK